ncbi:MAG: nucleotidyltransferase domain-containing protein [Candidatus Berkelbacteria bacterium]|nr:nucleotidyltransferase domain-containing protein [Candidatus Berkelbacteria bacterium]
MFKKILKSKWGRFRLIRNLVIGWISHSLQDRDRGEIAVHLAVEIIVFGVILIVMCSSGSSSLIALGSAFLIAHTMMFLLDGQLHCYIHDGIPSMQNAGIDEAVMYLSLVREAYSKTDSVFAVLVYGSFCRQEFRRRSDLDIRVIRRPGVWSLVRAIFIGFRLRYLSIPKSLPTDLLIVDSMEFVRKQMREDEHPVVLVLQGGFQVPEAGLNFESIIADPSLATKNTAFRTDKKQ